MLDGNTEFTERIIGCAIEVHRVLGPGLPEAVCETALCIELESRGIPFKRQVGVPVYYKGQLISEYRPDLIVSDEIVIEVKSVERTMRAGIRRVVLNA